MNFADPIRGLWLLPLVAAIILLWLHRPRRNALIVPSLRLWQGLETETAPSASRRFLRRHLLLFLQLVTTFLLVLALARPFLFRRAAAEQCYLFVMDNSASMQATDVSPSRIKRAQIDAAQFIARHLRPGDTAVVMQTSPRAQVLCRKTNDPARLRAALAQVSPTDAPGDMAGALTLAQTLVKDNANSHLQIFSDGLSASVPGSAQVLARRDTHQIVVGTRTPDNIGITAVDLLPDTLGTARLSLTVNQTGQQEHPGLLLTLSVDDRLQDARQISFVRGSAAAEFVVPLSDTPQIARVRLAHCEDDLASDNEVSLVLMPARKTNVLLVSPGNLFLERGLAALPNVHLSELSPAQFAASRAQSHSVDAVVLDGDFATGLLPPGRYLTFGRAGSPTPLTFTPQPATEVRVLSQNSAHPVMHFVDMHDIRLRSTNRTQSAGWGQVLADGTAGPLLVAGQHSGTRIISAGFSLVDSDWPVRIAFPLFLANSIAWLTEGSGQGTLQPDYAAGQTAQVSLPPGARSAQVTLPDGTVRLVSVPTGENFAAVTDTPLVGMYSVQGLGGTQYPLAINLLSPTTSALVPRLSPLLERPLPMAPARTARRVPQEWWTVAAALALVLLAAEWWVYHRRV